MLLASSFSFELLLILASSVFKLEHELDKQAEAMEEYNNYGTEMDELVKWTETHLPENAEPTVSLYPVSLFVNP